MPFWFVSCRNIYNEVGLLNIMDYTLQPPFPIIKNNKPLTLSAFDERLDDYYSTTKIAYQVSDKNRLWALHFIN